MLLYFISFFFEDLPVFQVNETNLWFLPVNCGFLTFSVDLSSLPIAHRIGKGLGHSMEFQSLGAAQGGSSSWRFYDFPNLFWLLTTEHLQLTHLVLE